MLSQGRQLSGVSVKRTARILNHQNSVPKKQERGEKYDSK
jgi:hypothetical protein